jgi:peptidyl-prolyl cis-trans isomerase B (cyclophilin B)
MKNRIKLFLLLLIVFTYSNSHAQGIDKPRYQIVTHRAGSYLGTLKIELFPLIAPNHCRNFDSLALALAYDSTAFHRVVPGFVIQGGDPNSINGPISTWGQGNSSQPIVNAEFSVVRHLRGIIGAARSTNINSATSQFYICVAPATFLDGNYTVYGKVTEGMNIVDTIVNTPRNANDVPLQKIEMFVTYIGVNDTVPATPVLTSPADNTLNINNTQNFNWTAVNGAVLYTTEFSTDSLFSIINYSRNSGINSTSLPNVLGNTKYYWRVKANNGGHESSYSNVRSFTTKAAPQLIYPANLDTGIVLTPVCRWTTVPGATSYLLQVATNTSFNSASLAYFQSGITDTSKMAIGLLPNTQYFWRVRGNQGVTQGLSSQVFSFTTGISVGIKSEKEEENKLQLKNLFPNPTQNEITLTLVTQQSEIVQLSVYDELGKLMLFEEKKLAIGIGNYKLDVSSLARGNYILNIKSASSSLNKNIQIE